MITLKFEKLYNIERLAQPCFVSVPLAQGMLKKEDSVCLWQNGAALPMQKRVLSYYPDGSVRYLFLRFLANILANKGTTVECELKSDSEASGAITEASGTELVDKTMEFCKNYVQTQFADDLLASGECSYHLQYGEWQVVEEGPVCVILSNQGRLVPEEKQNSSTGVEEWNMGLLCETRVTAFAGKSYYNFEIRLVNATEEPVSVTAWEYRISNKSKEENIRTCVADSNYKTNFLISDAGETVEKSITAELLMNQGNEHSAETFHGTFFADVTTEAGGVCATIFQAHQNFPKAVQAGRDGIVIGLIPQGSEAAVLQAGMAIEQGFQLYFHEAAEDLQVINHQSTMYQMPDVPVLPSQVYKESGLYPDIFIEKELQNGEVEWALSISADVHTRSYGMMCWGDAPDPNYTAQGRGQGSLVWTNNEYDFPHACMLEYARSGVRRCMDYCVVSGTHQRDVDICHYSTNPLLSGGQWEHTKGHCVDGKIVCSHQWVEGLLDGYHLTGDERFLEAALGIGENVLRLLDTPEYRKTGGLSARETGWALRTLTALYKETFEEKWVEKCDRIVAQFQEWTDTCGGWLSTYTDNTSIRVPFMISVAIGSLMRYYREFPREDIRRMILNAAEDLIENCYLDCGYFFYKELPTLSRVGTNPLLLEAMAIAYELTGEKKYLEYGKKTFGSAVQGSFGLGFGTQKRIAENAVLVGSTATKRFAQMYIPVVTYYKAAAEAGMLEV